MLRVRKDNERLLQDQENILKSLSEKQNQELDHPSVERGLPVDEDQQKRINITDIIEKSPF